MSDTMLLNLKEKWVRLDWQDPFSCLELNDAEAVAIMETILNAGKRKSR